MDVNKSCIIQGMFINVMFMFINSCYTLRRGLCMLSSSLIVRGSRGGPIGKDGRRFPSVLCPTAVV